MSLKKVMIFNSYHATWFFFLASGEIKCYLLLLQWWCKQAGRHRTSAQISAAWPTSDSKHVKTGLTGKWYQGVRFNLANVCMGFYFLRSIKCNLYTVYISIYIYVYMFFMLHEKCVKNGSLVLCLASRSENSNLAPPKSGQVETDIRYIWRNISPTWISLKFSGTSLNLINLLAEIGPFWRRLLHCNHLSTSASSWKSLKQIFGGKKNTAGFLGTNKKNGLKIPTF